jgi:hypothetical protein
MISRLFGDAEVIEGRSAASALYNLADSQRSNIQTGYYMILGVIGPF